MNSSLGSLLNDISEYLYSKFTLRIKKSRLKLYPDEKWRKFCEVNNFDPFCEGIYNPMDFMAYAKMDSPFLISNIFHEYFGHGLYVEHSQLGKQLLQLEAKLFAEERVASLKTINDLLKFRIENESYRDLIEFREQNMAQYEGFALWFEWYLSNCTGNNNLFDNSRSRCE